MIGLDAGSAGRVLGRRAGAVRTAAHRGLRRLAVLLERQSPAESSVGVEGVPPPRAGGGPALRASHVEPADG